MITKKILKYKYLILGAGPAGLSFANSLLEKGEKSFLVLEKESEAGGLCRSSEIDGSPLDIGGGHFLDVRNRKALDFIFKYMPEKEWNEFSRISKISIGNSFIDYPFESNIWQFPIERQVEYLLSVSKAGCNLNKKIPKKFVDWISWKLGKKIAEDYMIPYNQKIWSINLNILGTYWLYKLPDVSMKETLLSCLEKKPSGKIPAHSEFLYPKKYGYGEVWKRMAENLNEKIIYKCPIKTIDHKNKIVNGIYCADKIVNTIPWCDINFYPKLSKNILKLIKSLEYSSIEVSYDPDLKSKDVQWMYIPDKSLYYHRILYRSNFCDNSKGGWYEANIKRLKMRTNKPEWSYESKYAYPLNTINKPESINKILKYFSCKEIYGLGRWGEWEHMNSDIAVLKGLDLADKLVNNK